MMNAFMYGMTLAFGLILPLGMQNIFIFNQGAMQPHYIRALPSVLTAFLCDVILILCAVFSVSLIVLTTPWLKNVIFSVGIIFLAYMGISIWKTQSNSISTAAPLSTHGQIAFAASVSLLNPHAIIDTIGVIGTNSLRFAGYDKLAYICACLTVSLCWFFGLSIAGHYFNKLDKTGYGVLYANKLSAVIVWSIAIYLSWQLLAGGELV